MATRSSRQPIPPVPPKHQREQGFGLELGIAAEPGSCRTDLERWQAACSACGEHGADPARLVAARPVVQVPLGRFQVGVAHPLLQLPA